MIISINLIKKQKNLQIGSKIRNKYISITQIINEVIKNEKKLK